MATFTSNGRMWSTDYDQLVIPGKCVVDFGNLTVQEEPGSSPKKIRAGLAILLDILYRNRNHYLTSEQIANKLSGEGSGSAESVKADIGKLRALIGDKKPFSVIKEERGLGYKFVSDEEFPSRPLTLEIIFKRLLEAGEIRDICVVSSDRTLILETTAKPSANAIFDFFMTYNVIGSAIGVSGKEEFVTGKINSAKNQLMNFYWSSARSMDAVWDQCRKNVCGGLLRILKLKGMKDNSYPSPRSLEELDEYQLDSKALDMFLKKLVLKIGEMMAEPSALQTFFLGKRVELTSANAIDGIVALPLIAMYFLSGEYNTGGSGSFLHAEQYKKTLQRKIQEVFFSDTPFGAFVSSEEILRIAREALREAQSFFDDKSEIEKTFIKIFNEKITIDGILSNSAVTLFDTSNASEKESPVKSR